jgi:sulfite reductase (NADPH) hemoprotein beta-component
MDSIADLADRHGHGEIRVTHTQNLVLPHVRRRDLPKLWRALDMLGLATDNVGRATDIIACPGLDYCSLANARSIPVAQRLSERLAVLDKEFDLGPLEIKVSGCINACGHHHVGHIGLLGVDKNGEEFYQITLGGSDAPGSTIGTILGPAFSSARVDEAVETIARTYIELRQSNESFLAAWRRLGATPFKERLYATA